MSDAYTIPRVRERGPARRATPAPDPRPAATAMLRALLPGNEALIDTALFALAVELAKVEVGSGDLPIRMSRPMQAAYRRLERFWYRSLSAMTHDEMRSLCLELGGTEPA